MPTKARVLVVLANEERNYSCCECESRDAIRIVEQSVIGGFTETKGYCFPCSKKLLQESPGDPRL